MNSYIKESLLASLRSGKFTFYNGETQDIILTEQVAMYATFKHNGTIGAHFVGIIQISKLVESTLSAKNILSALENYLRSLDISLLNARFFCMDITNIISGERSGLKRLLKDAVPLGVWIGCVSEKNEPDTMGIFEQLLSPQLSQLFCFYEMFLQ